MSEERVRYLFGLHLTKSSTQAEKEELAALALETRYDSLIKELITESWDITGSEEDVSEERAKEILALILQGDGVNVVPIQRSKVRWMAWQKIAAKVAAAVVILLALGVGGYFLFFNKAKQASSVAQITHDVAAPKNTRAVIMLANGNKVYLDSAGTGTIAKQDNVNVVKKENGEIVYEAANAVSGSAVTVYNSVYNPRGSKVISLTLGDGTKVWLNSESSLKYPTAFTGNTREVEITGEAYFEVSHDAAKPFHVTLRQAQGAQTDITVLGTHFNVNAYDDEPATKVTLLEGSVEVKRDPDTYRDSNVKIKPGEQATLRQAQGDIQINKNVDFDEVMAWKNGYFKFNGATTEEIMRQVARWYDAEIYYEGDVKSERFAGSVPRTSNVSQLLKILELTKTVRFVVGDKKITVKPY